MTCVCPGHCPVCLELIKMKGGFSAFGYCIFSGECISQKNVFVHSSLLCSALPDLSIMWLCFSPMVSLQCVFVLVNSLWFSADELSIFRKAIWTFCSQEAPHVFHSECQVDAWLLSPKLILVISLMADGPLLSSSCPLEVGFLFRLLGIR